MYSNKKLKNYLKLLSKLCDITKINYYAAIMTNLKAKWTQRFKWSNSERSKNATGTITVIK